MYVCACNATVCKYGVPSSLDEIFWSASLSSSGIMAIRDLVAEVQREGSGKMRRERGGREKERGREGRRGRGRERERERERKRERERERERVHLH